MADIGERLRKNHQEYTAAVREIAEDWSLSDRAKELEVVVTLHFVDGMTLEVRGEENVQRVLEELGLGGSYLEG